MLVTELPREQPTSQGTPEFRRPGRRWQWGKLRWEEAPEVKISYKKNRLQRPVFHHVIFSHQSLAPNNHSLPFSSVLAPRSTEQEGAEQNASFIRNWWMQASSWLDNPWQPSLNHGLQVWRLFRMGVGEWGCHQNLRTRALSVEGPCRTGQFSKWIREQCQFWMKA